MAPAWIHQVRPNTLDEGHGIRTAVFFKGCPLRCAWCNAPESQRPGPEVAFDASLCQSCSQCAGVCPEDAVDTSHWPAVDHQRCTGCYACVDACPHAALTRLGEPLDAPALANEICSDLPFWRISGGGVTLTGGEPTYAMEEAAELARLLRSRGAHVLLQTCGHFDLAEFEAKLLPWISTIFFDLKFLDAKRHAHHCGTDNQRILENFVILQRRARKGELDLVPRVLLVPGTNTKPTELRAMAAFLKGQGVRRVALLLYDHSWAERMRALGREVSDRAPVEWPWITRTELWVCRGYFRGIEVVRPDGRSIARKEAGLGPLLNAR